MRPTKQTETHQQCRPTRICYVAPVLQALHPVNLAKTVAGWRLKLSEAKTVSATCHEQPRGKTRIELDH